MGFEFLFRGFSCFWGKHALRKEEISKESIGDLDGFVFLKEYSRFGSHFQTSSFFYTVNADCNLYCYRVIH